MKTIHETRTPAVFAGDVGRPLWAKLSIVVCLGLAVYFGLKSLNAASNLPSSNGRVAGGEGQYLPSPNGRGAGGEGVASAHYTKKLHATPIEQITVGHRVLSKNPGIHDETSITFADELEESAVNAWYTVQPDEVLPHGLRFKVENSVIVEAADDAGKKESSIIGTHYKPGDLDATDVTRPLWRYIDLSLTKPDGSKARLSVARPLWWLEATGAKPGATIDLAMHEAGVEGAAVVLRIRTCDADSREGDSKYGLVIGTIEHHNAVVLDLTFDGDSPQSLGVTASHPLYSFDRDDWIPAGELEIDEQVLTISGAAELTAKVDRPGRHTVYNIEVHRDHAYHVTQDGLLAHNTGVGDCIRLMRKFNGPIHHIASVEDKIFAPQFKELFNRAGLSMQSAWNKMRLAGHVGPHGKFYNNLILERLRGAVGEMTGDAARKALVAELKNIRREIRHEGLDALLKAPASMVDVMGKF